jgi:hypothetical protein
MLPTLAILFALSCTEPAQPMGTSFVCDARLDPLLTQATAYLKQRAAGGTVERQRYRLLMRGKTEFVSVFWEEQGERVKLTVEVRPPLDPPLLGESADAARALRSFLVEGVH